MIYKKIRQSIVILFAVALIFTFTSCGDKSNSGTEEETVLDGQQEQQEAQPKDQTDPQDNTPGDAAFLLDEYEKCVNDDDWDNFLELFSKDEREEVERLNAWYEGPHYLGRVSISDPIKIDNDVALEQMWFLDGLVENHDAVETYLAEVDYSLPDIDEEKLAEGDYNWIGLPFDYPKSRYLAFIMVEDGDEWKIDSIQKPAVLSPLVEKGILPYEETRDGELNALDLQLFEEMFSGIVYSKDEEGLEKDLSEVNGFFRSFYSEPKEIDLEEFIRYFGIRSWLTENSDSEELEEIGRLYKEKTGGDLADQLVFTPAVKYNKSDVDKVLMKYADITSDDLDQGSFSDLLYSEKYEAFYNFTSDFGPGMFSPDEGYVDDGKYTFIEHNNYDREKGEYYDIQTVFKRVGDDYKILSRMKG